MFHVQKLEYVIMYADNKRLFLMLFMDMSESRGGLILCHI